MVEATVGAVERGADIEHEFNIVRKIAQIERVWLVEVKSWERSEKMPKVDFRDVAREKLFHHILL